MSRPPLRVLHTSDVHLGDRAQEPGGLLHGDECLCPVDVMAHLVDEHQIDVLLIAGDLFDHGRVSDAFVTDVFKRLTQIRADVVLLPGNHDQHDDRAIYRRHRSVIDASGVFFFDAIGGAAHDVANGALRIWARSMHDHSPEFSPLCGVPAHPGDRWFIAAAHGHFVLDENDDAHRSSRILLGDVECVDADYIALGHWHVTTDLAERGATRPAWYCGAPMFGWGAKHMLLVDFAPDEPTRVTPIDVLNHPASSCPAPAALPPSRW